MSRSLIKLLAVGLASVVVCSIAWADSPNSTPYYLHALADLRDARAHLNHVSSDPVDNLEAKAIRQIDEAIGEVRRASIDDGKGINDHTPVDAHMTRANRFHSALALLEKAKKDVSHKEDQSDIKGLQGRVLQHIEDAEHEVHHAIDIAVH